MQLTFITSHSELIYKDVLAWGLYQDLEESPLLPLKRRQYQLWHLPIHSLFTRNSETEFDKSLVSALNRVWAGWDKRKGFY